jgi:nucleotide-binding universal stress UspA family protein
MLQNILLATDFSSASELALHFAASLARRYDSRLQIAHIIRPDAYQLVPAEAQGVALEQTRRYAEQQMTRLLVSGKLRGIPHHVLLATGDFWPVLSDMIQQNEVDLIVAGTHGRTGVRKLLLGSVAEEIFRLAPCPVLTVGPRVALPAEGEAGFAQRPLRRILFASDFTPHSHRATGYALSLAQENQALLTLLHVVEESPPENSVARSRLRELFIRKLEELVPPEAEAWCQTELRVEFGEPDEVILRLANDPQAADGTDLIVLGVRKAANFPGHLPPATAYKVVCQAHCPVLTVRG